VSEQFLNGTSAHIRLFSATNLCHFLSVTLPDSPQSLWHCA